MFNGHLSTWFSEYMPTFMAAGAFIKANLPFGKWLEIGVIAIVTTVLTTWTTTARLEEQVKAIQIQAEKLERQDEKILKRLNEIAENVAVIKARMK